MTSPQSLVADRPTPAHRVPWMRCSWMRCSWMRSVRSPAASLVRSGRIVLWASLFAVALQLPLGAGEPSPHERPGSAGSELSPDSEAARHAAVAFLRPVRTVRLAAGEPGLIASLSVQRGEAVAAGQVVLELETQVLQTQRQIARSAADAAGEIEALTLTAQQAERRVQRLAELAQQGLSSEEEYEQARVEARVANLKLRAAREERTRAMLRVQEVDALIAARRVVCPIAGYVTEIDREVGEFLSAQDPFVAEVVDLSQLRATFAVPTRRAVALSPGDRLRLRLPETDQTARGVVEHVGRTTDAATGRVRVDVLVANEGGHFRSGLLCEVPEWTQPATELADRRSPFQRP